MCCLLYMQFKTDAPHVVVLCVYATGHHSSTGVMVPNVPLTNNIIRCNKQEAVPRAVLKLRYQVCTARVQLRMDIYCF